MAFVSAFGALGIFIILGAISLLLCFDVFGGMLALVFNPLLRRLGLQGNSLPGSDLIGRRAAVVTSDESGIRVQLDGTTWNARFVEPSAQLTIGDMVEVVGVNGLTLDVKAPQ